MKFIILVNALTVILSVLTRGKQINEELEFHHSLNAHFIMVEKSLKMSTGMRVKNQKEMSTGV